MQTLFRPLFSLLLLAWCAAAHAAMLSDDPSDRLSTVPHNEAMEAAVKASRLGEVGVKFEGWNETVISYARLRVYELTGRTSIPGQNPTYTLLGLMYEPEDWFTAKILPVEHPEILTDLDVQGKWISAKQVVENPKLNDFFAKLTAMSDRKTKLDKLTKLLNAVEQTYRLGREPRVLNAFQSDGISPEMITELLDSEKNLKAKHAERDEISATVKRETPLRNAGLKLLARTKALGGIHEDFRIVPDAESIEGDWVTPTTVLASNPTFSKAGQQFDTALLDAFTKQKPEILAPAVAQFISVVGESRLYPTKEYRDATNLYINTNPWRMASVFYVLGTLAFAFGLYFTNPWGRWTGVGLMAVGFLVHTGAVGLRLFLKGHIPVSNMFEALTFMSWCVMLIAICAEAINRRGLVGLGATLVGFLMLTGVAMMPLHESRIHPLRAVLNSYWLNIHVTMMLFSYATFALAAVFAGIYLIRSVFRMEGVLSTVMNQQQTEEFAYRLVQLGWPLLTVGVTLGAVWADVAWGRAWGWDPKETWAFITWVTYTAYLHSRMVMGWRGTWSAAACLIGFLMVVITMLGVSYLPCFSGGLHSYASPT